MRASFEIVSFRRRELKLVLFALLGFEGWREHCHLWRHTSKSYVKESASGKVSPSANNQCRSPSTSLGIPITPDNNPHNSKITVTTGAENLRKAFPAGALIWTYIELTRLDCYRETPFGLKEPRIRGCTSAWRSLYHLGEPPRPQIGTIAWCVIGLLREQFRLNREPYFATWHVEY